MKKSPKRSSMDRGFSELDLVCSLIPFLVHQGYDVKMEVSNMGQSVDLVGLKGNHRWLTAIEVKKSDWKRALKQCQAHALVCDYIAIAIALKKVPEPLWQQLTETGWGLLLYDEEKSSWVWKIRPKVNRKVWRPQRKHFLTSLRETSHAS